MLGFPGEWKAGASFTLIMLLLPFLQDATDNDTGAGVRKILKARILESGRSELKSWVPN